MKAINLVVAAIVAIMFANCTPKQQTTEAEQTTSATATGLWILTEINNKAIETPDGEEPAFIIINLKDSTLAAYDGCNNLNGNVIAENDTIKFTNVLSTLAMCPDHGESAMLASILNEATNYKVEAKTLTLSNPDNSKSAKFSAVE